MSYPSDSNDAQWELTSDRLTKDQLHLENTGIGQVAKKGSILFYKDKILVAATSQKFSSLGYGLQFLLAHEEEKDLGKNDDKLVAKSRIQAGRGPDPSYSYQTACMKKSALIQRVTTSPKARTVSYSSAQ